MNNLITQLGGVSETNWELLFQVKDFAVSALIRWGGGESGLRGSVGGRDVGVSRCVGHLYRVEDM